MSSDPTRPMKQWWQQPQGPQDNPEPEERTAPESSPGHQSSAGYQGDTVYGDATGYQGAPGPGGGVGSRGGTGYQANQGYQGYQAGQGYQGSQETQRLPRDQGSQETQFYQTSQQYQAQQPQPSAYQPSPGYQPPASGYQPPAPGYQPPQSYQGYQGAQGPPPRARRRHRKWPWITLVVIVLLLVGADRGIKAYAEDQMASQFQNSVGLSGKPNVNIEGFPFLTQLAAQKFNKVVISATDETITAKSAGGGLLKIASLNATLQGMHIHGANSATIDDFNASALVTFSALGDIGGIPQGVTLSPDGPNRLKATLNVDPLGSFTAHATVTRVGQNQIHIHITDFGGIPDDGLFGNLADFTVTLPKLPAGVTIQSISITQQGLRITATGHNTTLTQ